MNARVIIFWEEHFPFVDTLEIDSKWLIDALPPVDSVKTAGVSELIKELSGGRVDLLINPYGSAFPKSAWPEILAYLEQGGCLLNLGGAPFSVPVCKDGGQWRPEIRQTAYHRELGINQVYAVPTDKVKKYQTTETEPLLSGLIEEFGCDCVYELQVRLTSKPDHPNEIGSSGSREAILRPLLYGLDSNGRRIVAPVVALDRIYGRFAGGRWVLANFKSGTLPRKEIITRLAAFAAVGAREFWVSPSFACYYPDERAALVIRANRFRMPSDEKGFVSLYIAIRKDNVTVLQENIDITDFRLPYMRSIPLKIPLSPGVYTVLARLSTGDPQLSDKFADHYLTGFWCYDQSVAKTTQPLTVGKDYFMRGEKVVPLVGTTYMASDVHRRFLFEPNVAVWERDFAEMKGAGINIIRTGFWTAFRHVMLEPGRPREDVMRAFTAFMLTAAKYEMPVIFNLFAFAPELFEGENWYLDPRSLQAQKEFVFALASRGAEFNNLMWDLVNEPSYPGGGRFWRSRPNYDQYERAAWDEWIKRRHASDDVTEKWRITPGKPLDLPDNEHFEDRYVFQGEGHLRVLDFRLFVQEVFGRWVREIRSAIRANGNPRQLITVGQDEGGQGERPNPQFHWKDVDFTCTHTWWLNDDLLWSGLACKTPEKPALVGETGIMHVEDPGRTARRMEEDCRNLLERKLVVAFASGGSGAIQWIWNTNLYMPDDNEAAIGLHRADLTAKPEAEPLFAIRAFMTEARSYMEDRQPEDVVMVIPYSGMFGPRDTASAPVRVATRAMHYHCNTPMRVVGEYTLENLGTPRLIVLPSPRVLSQGAWETLLKAVREGATLLATGPIDWDEYRRPAPRLIEIGIDAEVRPVTREERVIIFGSEYRLTFGGDKIHRVDKAVVCGVPNLVKSEQVGKGKLIWANLPFEHADNIEPLVALYAYALRQAGISPVYSVSSAVPEVLIRPLIFARGILYCVVSETDCDLDFDLTDNLTHRTFKVSIPAQRAIMFMLSRSDGTVVAEYGGGVARGEVSIGVTTASNTGL